jgi:hypothetical protein
MNVRLHFTPQARGASAVRCLVTPDPEQLRRRTIVFTNGSEVCASRADDYRQHVRTVDAFNVEERLAYYRRFMEWSAIKPTAHDLLFLVIDVLDNADHFAELDVLDDPDVAKIVRRLRVVYRATFRSAKRQRSTPRKHTRRERPSERADARVRQLLAEGPRTREEIVFEANGVAGRDTLYHALTRVAEYDRHSKRWRLKTVA